MAEEHVREREALEELVASEGWAFFVRRTLEETQGPGYIARMSLAVNSPDILDARVVHRTMLEVSRMLKWVPDRIELLQQAEQ